MTAIKLAAETAAEQGHTPHLRFVVSATWVALYLDARRTGEPEAELLACLRRRLHDALRAALLPWAAGDAS